VIPEVVRPVFTAIDAISRTCVDLVRAEHRRRMRVAVRRRLEMVGGGTADGGAVGLSRAEALALLGALAKSMDDGDGDGGGGGDEEEEEEDMNDDDEELGPGMEAEADADANVGGGEYGDKATGTDVDASRGGVPAEEGGPDPEWDAPRHSSSDSNGSIPSLTPRAGDESTGTEAPASGEHPSIDAVPIHRVGSILGLGSGRTSGTSLPKQWSDLAQNEATGASFSYEAGASRMRASMTGLAIRRLSSGRGRARSAGEATLARMENSKAARAGAGDATGGGASGTGTGMRGAAMDDQEEARSPPP